MLRIVDQDADHAGLRRARANLQQRLRQAENQHRQRAAAHQRQYARDRPGACARAGGNVPNRTNTASAATSGTSAHCQAATARINWPGGEVGGGKLEQELEHAGRAPSGSCRR